MAKTAPAQIVHIPQARPKRVGRTLLLIGFAFAVMADPSTQVVRARGSASFAVPQLTTPVGGYCFFTASRSTISVAGRMRRR
jgi:hypothetical protein